VLGIPGLFSTLRLRQSADVMTIHGSPGTLDVVAARALDGRSDPRRWRVHDRLGLALDWPQYSKGRYDGAQRDAERAGWGIWKGSYVEPWLYRACIRANGKPAACSDDANAHP
jgi:hypothetical protein